MPRSLFLPATLLWLLVNFAAALSTRAQSSSDGDFRAFLAQMDAAQRELQNGRAEPYQALWAQSDDVTLSGGFGGTIERGTAQIKARLAWVASQFSKGQNTIERLVATSSGDLGYVVQIEHVRFLVPGQTAESNRDYRVTMVFRKERGAWRIVHRQADSQFAKEAPK